MPRVTDAPSTSLDKVPPGPEVTPDPPAVWALVLRHMLLRYWKAIAATFVGATIVAGAIAYFVIVREYRAELVVATVTAQRGPSLSGLAATIANLNPQGGLTPTPDMVAALFMSNGVLSGTGRANAGGVSCVQRLSGAEGPVGRETEVTRLMRSRAAVTVDRRTGLMSVAMISSDTGAARLCVKEFVRLASERFTRTARGQAVLQTQGLHARVDTAAAKLRESEDALTSFLQRNRSIPAYSVAAAQHERLRRAVTIAEQVYVQARTEQEGAEARVWEETPAVVVVDDVPADLPRVPRGIAQRALFIALLATLVVTVVLTWMVARREPYATMLARASAY